MVKCLELIVLLLIIDFQCTWYIWVTFLWDWTVLSNIMDHCMAIIVIPNIISSVTCSLVVSRSGWGGDQGVSQRWCTGGGEWEEVDHEPLLSATCSWRGATCCTGYVASLEDPSPSPVFIVCINEWAMTVSWNSRDCVRIDVTRCSSLAHSVFTKCRVLKPNFVSVQDHRIASDVQIASLTSATAPLLCLHESCTGWLSAQRSGELLPICISAV